MTVVLGVVDVAAEVCWTFSDSLSEVDISGESFSVVVSVWVVLGRVRGLMRGELVIILRCL